jgi:2-polyprenyl-3-methyl-5-hydroxy-6-metoxy-1,4-benzoquinol methylase
MQATGFHKSLRVSRADVYDASDSCPVCRSSRARRAVFSVQHDPEIDMLECFSCGAFSASQMPRAEVLDRYYAQYYEGLSNNYTLDDASRFARHILRFMPDLTIAGELRILDFGGGDGSLAIALARDLQNRASAPISITIDVVDYAIPKDTEHPKILIKGHKELENVEGGFDIVLASAILEHLPDAHTAIRRLTSLTTKRAYMYARTPSVLPIARLITSIDITYPAHVHDMGSAFWNRFTRTFDLDAHLISSRPSLVETTLRSSPVRTALAHGLKLPALIELALFGRKRPPLWNFVGGWEVVVRFRG